MKKNTMEQSHTTEIYTTLVSTMWKIKGLGAINTGYLMSPKFTVKSEHSSQTLSWCYKLVPKKYYQSKYYTSVEVVVKEQNGNDSLRFFADVEAEFKSVETGELKTSGVVDYLHKSIGSELMVKREAVDKYLLKHDDLTLRIKISLHEEFIMETQEPKKKSQPEPQLLDHFANLLSNASKFSDMTVIIGQKEFFVHRAILAVRSPVFAAMFEHTEMKESQKNQVIIEDILPHVFQQVLRFIYTDSIQGLDEMAHELLAAADKYALDRLRSMCEEFLGKSLSVETVTETLHLADLHHAMKLRREAIEFIARNITEMQTTDWKSLLTNNPDVAAEMFSELTKRVANKMVLNNIESINTDSSEDDE